MSIPRTPALAPMTTPEAVKRNEALKLRVKSFQSQLPGIEKRLATIRADLKARTGGHADPVAYCLAMVTAGLKTEEVLHLQKLVNDLDAVKAEGSALLRRIEDEIERQVLEGFEIIE